MRSNNSYNKGNYMQKETLNVVKQAENEMKNLLKE